MRLLGCLQMAMSLILSSYCIGQDTIRLNRKPNVIIRSWYPEYKNNPSLPMGKSKIVFSIIAGHEDSPVQWYPIELIPSSSNVYIKETGKPNQFLITTDSTSEKKVELECWWVMGNNDVLIKQKKTWFSIKHSFPTKENKVLIDRIQLKIK